MVGLVLCASVGVTAAPAGAGIDGTQDTESSTTKRPDFGVGRRDVTLVDTTRPTMADPSRDLPARPDRTLQTVVLYPTRSGAQDPPRTDARAAKGRFPLLVFSHGFTATGDLYAPFFDAMVRRGYVVALPTFPLTSGPGANIADYVNQPGDVSFVIDELLGLSRHKGTWLSGRLRPDDVGAAGHSMGGLNTLAVTYNQCCIDSRVKAAASLAGGELPFPGGSWDDPPGTPLLLVHGVPDTSVPIGASDQVFAAATGPTSYLRLTNADHVGLFFGDDGVLTMRALLAFFDAELNHHRKDLRVMPRIVTASGLGEWRVKH